MPRYAYTASDTQQRLREGELDAGSRQLASRQLQVQGLRPVRLRECDPSGMSASPRSPDKNAATQAYQGSTRDRLPFLKALNALISSGYPVGEALRLLPRRLKDRKLRALSLSLWDRLSSGATFSRALEDHPEIFDAQCINLIRAGEATGNVREVMRRLIQHYTAMQQLQRRVLSALCYPVFICLVAMGVLLFFAMFLMPRLQGLLQSLGGSLPFATRALLAASHGLLTYGPFAAVMLAIIAVSLWRWRKTGTGRLNLDAFILRVPLLGPLTVDTSMQGFCQTLAVLLENGVTLVEALRITEQTVPNQVLSQGFRRAADSIIEGQSLPRALAQVPFLPDTVSDRFSIGENTGELAPHLRDLAVEMDAELTHRLKTMTDVMSTAVLLLAFSFVGFVAYAIVSAVFQVSASFKF